MTEGIRRRRRAASWRRTLEQIRRLPDVQARFDSTVREIRALPQIHDSLRNAGITER